MVAYHNNIEETIFILFISQKPNPATERKVRRAKKKKGIENEISNAILATDALIGDEEQDGHGKKKK